MRATSIFNVKKWDEKPYDENGPKLTRASVTFDYHGDLEGEGNVEFLMVYREDGIANYISLERVAGTLGGRAGSYVLQGTGTYENGIARVEWVVVPHSGTGELRGLSGKGGYSMASGDEQPKIEFEYELK